MSNDDSYVKSKSGRFGGKFSQHQTSNELNEQYSNSSGDKKHNESSQGSNRLISQKAAKKGKVFHQRKNSGPQKKTGQTGSLSPRKRGEIKPRITPTVQSKSVKI